MTLLPTEGSERPTGYFWPQTEFHRVRREAFVPLSSFWKVSVWFHWGPAHYTLHFLMMRTSWPQGWELQLPVDAQGRCGCLSSPQTALKPWHACWHEPGKGEHLPKGPASLSHCLPFPMRQMEIKTVMETCSDCKVLVLVAEAFPWIDAVKQRCKWIHLTALICSHFIKEGSTITKYKHVIKAQALINLQFHALHKPD